jgi:hypothetical protein
MRKLLEELLNKLTADLRTGDLAEQTHVRNDLKSINFRDLNKEFWRRKLALLYESKTK